MGSLRCSLDRHIVNVTSEKSIVANANEGCIRQEGVSFPIQVGVVSTTVKSPRVPRKIRLMMGADDGREVGSDKCSV